MIQQKYSQIKLPQRSPALYFIEFRHGAHAWNTWRGTCHVMYSVRTLVLDFTSKTCFPLIFSFFNSTFVFDIPRCTFSTRFVKITVELFIFDSTPWIKLNTKVIVQRCYFLLVLIPEPVVCIFLICELCTRYYLDIFYHSPPQIANSTSKIFNSTLWIFVYASVIIGEEWEGRGGNRPLPQALSAP